MNEGRAFTPDAAGVLIRRLQIRDADASFASRLSEIATGMQAHLARIPVDFDKGVEPAHVLSVPLR